MQVALVKHAGPLLQILLEGFARSAQENHMLECGNEKKEKTGCNILLCCTHAEEQNVEITVMEHAMSWLRSRNCTFTGFTWQEHEWPRTRGQNH